MLHAGCRPDEQAALRRLSSASPSAGIMAGLKVQGSCNVGMAHAAWSAPGCRPDERAALRRLCSASAYSCACTCVISSRSTCKSQQAGWCHKPFHIKSHTQYTRPPDSPHAALLQLHEEIETILRQSALSETGHHM